MHRHTARKIFQSHDRHSFALRDFVENDPGHVAAGFHREVHHHAARLHGVKHLCGEQNGRLATKHLGGANDDVRLGAGLGHRGALL